VFLDSKPSDWPPSWRGLELVPTNHATEKMHEYGMRLYDVANILEYGSNCGDKRKDGTHERCEKWGKKDIKVVVFKAYSGWVDGEAWIIKTVIMKR